MHIRIKNKDKHALRTVTVYEARVDSNEMVDLIAEKL